MSVTISGDTGVSGNTGALTAGTAVTASGQTSIDFTSIPSWAKRVTVMFAGVSTSGSSIVQLQLGDSGGIEATGYLGSVDTTAAGVAAALFTTGLAVSRSGGTSSAAIVSGQAIFSLIGSNTWAGSLLMAKSDAAGVNISACSKALSDTLTQVRITTVNGTDTFDAGSINILYE